MQPLLSWRRCLLRCDWPVDSVLTCGPAAPIKLPPGQRKQQQITQSHKLETNDDKQVVKLLRHKATLTLSFLFSLHLPPSVCLFSSFQIESLSFTLNKRAEYRLTARHPSATKLLSDVSVFFPNLLPGRDPNRTRITSRRTSAALTSGSRSKLQADPSSRRSTQGSFLFGGLCEVAVWTLPLLRSS